MVGQGPASFGNFIGDNVDFVFSDELDGPWRKRRVDRIRQPA
jgi:hypothetical protein